MPPNYSTYCVFLLVAIGYYEQTHAQIFTLGSCPNPNVVSNFQIDQYLGKWYNNRNYFSIFQTGLHCITADYTMNGDAITIKNEGLSVTSGKRKTVNGMARVVGSSILTVSFTSIPFMQGAENYLILDTDYDSYAVVWSCFPYGLFYSSTAWILTRDPNPSNATIDLALAVFEKNAINQTKLKVVNQQDC